MQSELQSRFFSQGLQGIVFGLYHNIANEEEGLLISLISQFGQTLADEYFRLRKLEFIENFDKNKQDLELSGDFISLLSPIQSIIVNKNGDIAGYNIEREHDYWAGYIQINQNELDASVYEDYVDFEIANGINVYIKPIEDEAYFDAEFSRMRLESCLRTISRITKVRENIYLALHEVQRVCEELKFDIKMNGHSIAKIRQYFVASKIEENWIGGRIILSNFQAKEFIQDIIGNSIKRGYQISSFSNEIERLFPEKISVKKSRNGLFIEWN